MNSVKWREVKWCEWRKREDRMIEKMNLNIGRERRKDKEIEKEKLIRKKVEKIGRKKKIEERLRERFEMLNGNDEGRRIGKLENDIWGKENDFRKLERRKWRKLGK